ncbi:MAG: hypothetical protein IIA01_00750 [Proteobacteria bacterium]|nr:hypothetical protein [Pseudomonadota bacterium]
MSLTSTCIPNFTRGTNLLIEQTQTEPGVGTIKVTQDTFHDDDNFWAIPGVNLEQEEK